jgi:hypothetical protein
VLLDRLIERGGEIVDPLGLSPLDRRLLAGAVP